MLTNHLKDGCAVFFNASESGGAETTEKQANETNAGTTGDNETTETSPQVEQCEAAAVNASENKYSDKDIEALKKEFSREKQETVITAVNEALKKAKMSPDELAKHEEAERAAELNKRETEIYKRELRAATAVKLESEKLPKEILSIVVGADDAATDENIKIFKTVFDKAVQEQVAKQLTGKTPSSGNSAAQNTDGGVREKFRKGMGLNE